MKNLLLLICCFLIMGCSHNNSSEYNSTHFLMNTTTEIKVKGAEQKALQQSTTEAFAAMQTIADECNAFEPALPNNLYHLNKSKVPMAVGDHLYKLVEMCKHQPYPEFDISIFPLKQLWHNAVKSNSLPTATSITQALQNCGSSHYHLNKNNHTITLDKNTQLDLGALAKGYAVDAAYKVLKRNTAITEGFINAGGNIRVLGTKSNQQPWLIGVEDPRDKTKLLGKVTLQNGEAISTSSNSYRYYEIQGKKYSHIFNPSTGLPVENNLSATVISTSALTTDFFSTILFIMPAKEGIKLVNSIPHLDAIIMDKGGKLHLSTEAAKIFQTN